MIDSTETVHRNLKYTDTFKEGDEYFHIPEDLCNSGLWDGKWYPVTKKEIGRLVSATDFDPSLCRRPIKSFEDLY